VLSLLRFRVSDPSRVSPFPKQHHLFNLPLPLFCCTFPPTFGGLKWVCILPPHSLFMSLISLECLPFQNNSIFSSFPFPYSVAPSPNLWWAQIGVYTSSLLPFCVSNASRVFPFPITLDYCSLSSSPSSVYPSPILLHLPFKL